MMKMIKNDSVFIIPEYESIILLIMNQCGKKVIQNLQEFFGKKKKNACKLISDDGEIILPNDYNFIYIPYDTSIDNNLDLKEKTTMNVELTKFIEENPEMFTSMDRLRNNIHELKTDIGMYRLYKIMKTGIIHDIKCQVQNIDISKLLSFYTLNNDELLESEKYILLYNIMLYETRNENNIIYIDFPIDEITLEWINKQNKENKIFILNHNQIINNKLCSKIEKSSILLMSNKDYLETYEYDIKQISYISYIFHPFVIQNMSFQNQEIIQLFSQFDDENTTFYLKFNSHLDQ